MNKFLILFLTLPFLNYGQEYRFQKEINSIEDKWHKINLDDEILSSINNNFSDIRIFEVTTEKDTLSVPYFIEKPKDGITKKGINFSVLNKSKKENDYYITFQAKNDLEINEIDLSFQEENYKYEVNLEGSQNQDEWFAILENYRLLSIKNKLTDYSFNKLNFPSAKYKFYRVKIKDNNDVNLKAVKMQHYTKANSAMVSVSPTFNQKNENTISEIFIDLKKRFPISQLSLKFQESERFYRPIKIQYLIDSVKTNKGYYYNYSNLKTAYVSSYEPSIFDFETNFTNKLKVVIQNNDNQALELVEVKASRKQYEAIARFGNPESDYYLLYGNAKAKAPSYDIVNFKKEILKELKTLSLGSEIDLSQTQKDSIFENKHWLWLILLVIITLIAYSRCGMLKKK